MSEPKSPEIEDLLCSMFPDRAKEGVCATCSSTRVTPEDFKDALSRREFEISKMCQNCQDSVFEPEDLL